MSTEFVILVVADDPNEREAIGQMLGTDRFHVVAADNADDAVGYLEDSVDLVISQLRSRTFNGVDLLQRWKQRQPQTPFVLVTEGDDISLVVEAMKLGAADCVVKPIRAEDLQARVLEILESRNANGQGGGARQSSSTRSHIDIPPGTSLEDLERAAVEQALAQHHGNRTHAAKTLGISVRTLQRKLKAWGMPVLAAQNHNSSEHFLLPAHAGAPNAFSAHVH